MGLGKVLEAGFHLGLPVMQRRCMSAIGTDSVCIFKYIITCFSKHAQVYFFVTRVDY